MVAAAAWPIILPELQPHLSATSGGAEELAGFWCLGTVGVAAATTVLGILVLPLFPRFGGEFSGAIEETWRLLYRSEGSGGRLWSALWKHLGAGEGSCLLAWLCAYGGLLWCGFADEGWRLRLLLQRRLEVATPRSRWLGDASPPMFDLRLRFRRCCRMTTAVLQRSLAAIEPRLALGLRMTRFLHLQWRCGGAGVQQGRVAWLLCVRACKDLLVFFLFVRALSALSPGQVTLGMLLECGCVCGLCTCLCLSV